MQVPKVKILYILTFSSRRNVTWTFIFCVIICGDIFKHHHTSSTPVFCFSIDVFLCFIYMYFYSNAHILKHPHRLNIAWMQPDVLYKPHAIYIYINMYIYIYHRDLKISHNRLKIDGRCDTHILYLYLIIGLHNQLHENLGNTWLIILTMQCETDTCLVC